MHSKNIGNWQDGNYSAQSPINENNTFNARKQTSKQATIKLRVQTIYV